MPQGEFFAAFSGNPEAKVTRVRRPADTPHQRCIDLFHELYLATRGVAWSWTPPDLRWIRLALRDHAKGDEWTLKERIRALLTSPPSRWFAANAAPILLYRKWNELGVKVSGGTRDERNAAALRQAMVEL